MEMNSATKPVVGDELFWIDWITPALREQVLEIDSILPTDSERLLVRESMLYHSVYCTVSASHNFTLETLLFIIIHVTE